MHYNNVINKRKEAVIMEMKIGTKIAELRRNKGMTQEQLAEKLGISAPAVSKWETNSSYPDITLLCPLARALDTNVDTLLHFEETLSDQDVADKINTVIETALADGYESGEAMVFELLHKYPNSIALRFNAALVFDTFQMFFPSVDETIRQAWRSHKKDLLLDVRAAGTGTYWQNATMMLASIAISKKELTQAEQLLKELPEHVVDPTLSWSRLYLEKDEPLEALKVVQKRLYVVIRQVQSCLSMMMNPKMIADTEQILKICEVYRSVDQLFDCGGGMYDGMFLNVYLQMNHMEDAADCLEHYVDVITGTIILPKPYLFTPGLDFESKQGSPATTKELRQTLLKALTEDEHYEALSAYPQAQRAIEKLKESL